MKNSILINVTVPENKLDSITNCFFEWTDQDGQIQLHKSTVSGRKTAAEYEVSIYEYIIIIRSQR